MKTIKIKKLTLQDWRAQNKIVTFSDHTEIRGRNKTGKSSVYNGFLWLLTGADDMDRNNYNLFDNTIEQTHETSKVASVEGVFEINSVEYTLKRTAEIGWTRKKGHEEYERAGTDNYKFYIDGIERGATEYKKTIEELFAPVDKLKIMLNLQYFLRMDWKQMRKHLQDMVGEITIDDFNGDYSDILNDLKKYSPEEVKISYKAKINPIKQSIESLPITIETLKSSLPDISNLEEVQQDIDDTKSQIEMIDKQLSGSNEAMQGQIEKRNAELAKIAELQESFVDAKRKSYNEHFSLLNKLDAKISEINVRNEQISRDNAKGKETIIRAGKSLSEAKNKLDRLTDYRLTLLKQNEEVKKMQFTDDKCPYCGQMLPDGKLEEAKAKFNERKEAKHLAVVAEGKANNQKIADCKKDIEALQEIVEKGYVEKPLEDASSLQKEIDDLKANFVPYEETIEGKEKMAEISSLKANLPSFEQSDNTALINTKKSLLDDIQELSKQLGKKDEYDKQVEKIIEKEKELKDSAVELARLEGLLNKVNQYEREKASIISDRVNGKFDYVKVEMTEVNKSGDIVDTCRILDSDGVNASVTNFASQVRCGMDISTAFCKFYGLNLPMFIDFAESMNEDNLPETERQMVRLIVDDCKFNVINK